MKRTCMAMLAGLLVSLPGMLRADALKPADLGSTARVHQFGDVLLASQPTAADIALARERGVRTVVNLRLPAEPAGFDEPAAVAQAGLDYVALPFGTPAQLTDEVFDRTRDLLNNADAPLLLHCASANRVGAVWLPWRVLDSGASLEQALAEARQIGLKSEELEQRARAYIESRQAGP